MIVADDLSAFIVGEWERIPEHLLSLESGDVQYGYRTDIGWFILKDGRLIYSDFSRGNHDPNYSK